MIHNLHRAVLRRASPLGPRLVSEQLEAVQELLISLSVGITCTAHPNVL